MTNGFSHSRPDKPLHRTRTRLSRRLRAGERGEPRFGGRMEAMSWVSKFA
jgi:hypothetical protein